MTMTVLHALWGAIKQFGTKAIKQEQNDAPLVLVSRTLILGTLFAGLLTNSTWAQNKDEPPGGGPPYPGGSEITFQWNYSRPSRQNCSFTCAAPGGASGASGASGVGM